VRSLIRRAWTQRTYDWRATSLAGLVSPRKLSGKPIREREKSTSCLTSSNRTSTDRTGTHEGTGEYVHDSIITTKVKAAIFNEPGLKVSEVRVETFKGVVQLSGFVSSRADIKGAVRVASAVSGVKSVTNDMQLE
jgi:osmotically-inducible protein OsmY